MSFSNNCELNQLKSGLSISTSTNKPRWGGGALVFYHPHKRTFQTHPTHIFFRYENRPQIQVFACVFLYLSIMSFPKFVTMTKNTPFFPILHVFAPLNNVRAYIAWSWKTTLITWIFLRGWYPTSTQVPPGCVLWILEMIVSWIKLIKYVKKICSKVLFSAFRWN